MRRVGWLERLALRAVPRDWRDGVERDLRDESSSAPVFAARALGIGIHLQASRVRNGFILPRGGFMRDFGRDLRLALRGVVRRPAYSLAVVATLAIGIGANTAIFSVFNWILFRPVPGVDRPEELVTVRFQRPSSDGRFFVSYRDVADLRAGIPALSGLAASAAQSMSIVLAAGADPERIEGEVVTADYFDVLGVKLRSGRGFLSGEEHPGAETPPAIISDTLRRRTFASVSDVLGQQLSINGHVFTIVGVVPAEFRGRTLIASTDLWVPTGAHMFVMPLSGADLLTERRRTLFIDAVGRLRPGATVAQAQEQARAAAAAVPDYGGRRPGSKGSGIVPTLFPGLGLDQFATARLATMWRLLTGAVGLVLVLACANAGNLLLARALGRRREIAVCQAIGASRLRLVRQQFAEGLVLALLAGGAGLLVALALMRAFDGMRIVTFLPEIEGVGLDWRVGAFTLAIAIATGVLFSLAPALVSSRVDLQAWLKDGLTSSRRGRGWLRASLVTVQVAISVLLLVGAGLLARTLHNVRALDLGVNLDGLVTFFADPTRLGYKDVRASEYFQTLLERLRAAPGIQSVAFVWSPPYSNMLSEVGLTRAEGADKTEHDAENTRISRGYFEALGVPLVAGRDFSDADYRDTDDGTGDVAIVSERLAKELFPEGGAVGSRLVLSYPKGKLVEIIGVAGNVRRRPVTKEPEPFIYMPGISVWGSVAVRSSLPFAQTGAAIRAVARDLEPALPPYDLEPMAAGLDRVISEQRLLARFSGIFASVAALLAAVGIYGMMAGAVAERRREFGIRLALGARARSVLTLVLRGALPIVLAGVAAGLAGSFALGKVIASRLYGVHPSDPLTLAVVTSSLAFLALAASFVPALKASRVDPVQSLRVE
jgi:predicted permease